LEKILPYDDKTKYPDDEKIKYSVYIGGK